MVRPKRVVNPDPDSDDEPTKLPPTSPCGSGLTRLLTKSHSKLVLNPSISSTPTLRPKPSTLTLAGPSSSKLTGSSTSLLSRTSSTLVEPSTSVLKLKPSTSTFNIKPRPSNSSAPIPRDHILVLRTHNSTQAHINKLPPELLSSIFLLLHSPLTSSLATLPSPRQISQVCHSWRSIALNEPLLWAHTLNLREGPKWIVEVLKRSGECLLDVVGSYSYNIPKSIGGGITGGSSRSGGTSSVLGAILKELKRVRKLNLTVERREDWRVIVDTLSRNEAPALDSLTVKNSIRRIATPGVSGPLGATVGGFGAGAGLGGFEEVSMRLPDGLFRGSAPVLRSLTLAMVALGSSTGGSLPWLAGLTTLQVTDLEDQYLMSVWEWLAIVRQTPLLEKLALKSVFADEVEPDSPEDAGRVVLKRLKNVDLRGTMMECCEFLKRLVVPGECSIHMDTKRANNAHAANVLSEFFRERKMRVENMEEILKTPDESIRAAREKKRRSFLVHPSTQGLHIKVDEMVGEEKDLGPCEVEQGQGEEQEENCHVNLILSFGPPNQSEERHQLVMDIFETLTRALQMVYEDKGSFGSLNLSLFGLRDGIKFWETQLAQFFSRLDRVEHLQEVSGYTASVVFPLLVQSPLPHRPPSFVGLSSSPSERYRQSVLLPSLQRITLAFVEFSVNVDDEFEGCCDVSAVPDFVRRRLGLGLEVGGISVVRQRMLRLRFECCSGPQWILDDLRQLGVECSLGWACDFEDS